MTGIIGWQSEVPLILASGSKTRQAMLAALDLPIEIFRPDVDEAAMASALLTEHCAVAGIAQVLAREKALAVSRQYPRRYVLAADQTLECEGKLFMKAGTTGELRANLEQLSGRKHLLWSAACLVKDDEILWAGIEKAEMEMLPLSQPFLDDYLARRGEAMLHSVGGYEIEGFGPMLFSAIEGHHSTILGLPLLALLAGLRDLRLIRSC